jgi:zinc transport system permease protein
MSVRAIGIILILALFTIPPLIAEKFTTKFSSMIVLSTILGAIFIISGILISYFYDIAPTPAIVVVASLTLFISMLKGR